MTTPRLQRPSAEVPGPGESWTVLRLILWSADYLARKGIPQARLDAEHLLAGVLATGRLELYLQYDRPLEGDELARYREWLLRRAAREPLQYIRGRTAFRELELRTDRRGLIPRPETEELVDVVLAWAREGARRESTALDIGTGTGAIALSLAREGSFRRVVATDRSTEALALARENRDEALLSGIVELRSGSAFEPVIPGERFDVIVSNPPYVRAGELEGLAPEVRDWEPVDALVSGPTGLEVAATIVDGAADHLEPGGLLALEIGADQGPGVLELVRRSGRYRGELIRRDLSGRDRIVTAELGD